MTTEAPPPGSGDGEGGGAPPDPFDAIRAAGLDPDTVDWADIAAKAQYVDALTDPNRHFDTLESSLRQWGHLPEGSSLSDMFSADADDDDANDTPPWQKPQNEPQVIGYDAGGEPVYARPPGQQSEFNPAEFAQQFEDRLLKNVDKRIEERSTAQTREIMAQRMVSDIEGQMEQVTQKYELNEGESAYLWNHVRSQLATMDNIQDPRQVKGLVDQAWQQIDAIANGRVAKLTDPNRKAPMTTDRTGPPPSRESPPPGTDAFGAMMNETATRLGLDGYTED